MKLSPEKAAERMELYKSGATDAEIAGKQSVTVSAVNQWRDNRNLPANIAPVKDADGEADLPDNPGPIAEAEAAGTHASTDPEKGAETEQTKSEPMTAFTLNRILGNLCDDAHIQLSNGKLVTSCEVKTSYGHRGEIIRTVILLTTTKDA